MGEKTKKNGLDAHLKLILLQSGICVAVVLLALLLRVAGGSVFNELKQNFRAAVEDDGLLDELSRGTTATSVTTTVTLPTATTEPSSVPGTTADARP